MPKRNRTPPVSTPNAGEPAGTPTQAQAADTAVKKVEETFRGILGRLEITL